MLDKEVIDAIRSSFHTRFELMQQQDSRTAGAFESLSQTLCGNIDDRNTAEEIKEEINNTMTEASVLAYYIGIQDGAKLVASLGNGQFVTDILAAAGELTSAGNGGYADA